MRILWVVIDALGNEQLTTAAMPRLSALADEGGRAPSGGVGVLPALTYPNHATFVTGVQPHVHGIVTNLLLRDGAWVGAETVGPAAPTVFDQLSVAGRATVAVVGDQNLVGVCGAAAATRHWPDNGMLAPATATGLTGYAADAEVLGAAQALGVADFDLAFVHLDETDAVRHVHGPNSPEAMAQALRVDETLAALLSQYAQSWTDTVVIVLSDHDQEPVAPGAPVALGTIISDLLGGRENGWRCDGTAGWVSPDPRVTVEALAAVSGIAGVQVLPDGAFVVWGGPGVVLGIDWGQGGDHGSPRTRSQVAVVGGGHPAARELGARIRRRVPGAGDWAPWVLKQLEASEEP